VSEEERVLLYIEKQAVVQVMIRAIAQNLDVKDNTKIQAVSMCVCEGKEDFSNARDVYLKLQERVHIMCNLAFPTLHSGFSEL